MYNPEQKRDRLDATAEFERVRYWASLRRLWAKITRQQEYLLPFSTLEPYLSQKRFYKGEKEISVGQIVGSVNRPRDFSRTFQPLRDSSKERWVAMWMLQKTTGWPPIRVYQVGNLYFVEDGHHRVSVARQLRLKLIEAEIWEYQAAVQAAENISIAGILGQLWQALTDSPHGCVQSTR
jgi:hypothetical protein